MLFGQMLAQKRVFRTFLILTNLRIGVANVLAINLFRGSQVCPPALETTESIELSLLLTDRRLFLPEFARV